MEANPESVDARPFARAASHSASTGSASACRASTTSSCASSAASTTPPGPKRPIAPPATPASTASASTSSSACPARRPRSGVARWRRAVALGPDHLSLYALTLEEDTPLARRVAAGEYPEPDPDVQADMYTWSAERLAAAGYEQYEISNWARPGHRCRHNLTYWRSEPYLGLGAGAHSYVGGCRLANVRLPAGTFDLVTAAQGARPCDPSTLPQVESMRRAGCGEGAVGRGHPGATSDGGRVAGRRWGTASASTWASATAGRSTN